MKTCAFLLTIIVALVGWIVYDLNIDQNPYDETLVCTAGKYDMYDCLSPNGDDFYGTVAQIHAHYLHPHIVWDHYPTPPLNYIPTSPRPCANPHAPYCNGIRTAAPFPTDPPQPPDPPQYIIKKIDGITFRLIKHACWYPTPMDTNIHVLGDETFKKQTYTILDFPDTRTGKNICGVENTYADIPNEKN